MSPLMNEYRDLYVWDLAEQRAVLEGIRVDAVRLGDEALLARVDEVRALNREAWDVGAAWEVLRALPPAGRDASAVDAENDRLLGVVFNTLSAVAGSELYPLSAPARSLLSVAFPRGLGAHVKAKFVAQQFLNADFVDHVRDPRHAAVIEGLALGPLVDRIAELSAIFSGMVNGRPAVTAESARAAADLCGDETFSLVCSIIGEHRPGSPERVARREALLTEVRATQARMRSQFVSVAHRRATGTAVREAPPACAPTAPAGARTEAPAAPAAAPTPADGPTPPADAPTPPSDAPTPPGDAPTPPGDAPAMMAVAGK